MTHKESQVHFDRDVEIDNFIDNNYDKLNPETRKRLVARDPSLGKRFDRWCEDCCDANDPTGIIWSTFCDVRDELLKAEFSWYGTEHLCQR